MFENKKIKELITDETEKRKNELAITWKELENIKTEHQRHLIDFVELRKWVIEYVAENKNKVSIPDELRTRIVELEAKQSKLWDLLTKESPQTKEAKLSPMGRRTRTNLLLR